jgi:hypothetical protein
MPVIACQIESLNFGCPPHLRALFINLRVCFESLFIYDTMTAYFSKFISVSCLQKMGFSILSSICNCLPDLNNAKTALLSTSQRLFRIRIKINHVLSQVIIYTNRPAFDVETW